MVLALHLVVSPFDRLAEGCDKVRGPVEQNLEQQQTFSNIQVREKYLGNICSEKGWTL